MGLYDFEEEPSDEIKHLEKLYERSKQTSVRFVPFVIFKKVIEEMQECRETFFPHSYICNYEYFDNVIYGKFFNITFGNDTEFGEERFVISFKLVDSSMFHETQTCFKFGLFPINSNEREAIFESMMVPLNNYEVSKIIPALEYTFEKEDYIEYILECKAIKETDEDDEEILYSYEDLMEMDDSDVEMIAADNNFWEEKYFPLDNEIVWEAVDNSFLPEFDEYLKALHITVKDKKFVFEFNHEESNHAE
jgi:hypothetical protein